MRADEMKPGKLYRLHVEGQEKDDVLEALSMIEKYIINEYETYDEKDRPWWYENIKPNVTELRAISQTCVNYLPVRGSNYIICCCCSLLSLEHLPTRRKFNIAKSYVAFRSLER
jgi:hypothetical protein